MSWRFWFAHDMDDGLDERSYLIGSIITAGDASVKIGPAEHWLDGDAPEIEIDQIRFEGKRVHPKEWRAHGFRAEVLQELKEKILRAWAESGRMAEND